MDGLAQSFPQLIARVQVELVEDAFQMLLDRSAADEEAAPDFGVAQPPSNEVAYLGLAVGEESEALRNLFNRPDGIVGIVFFIQATIKIVEVLIQDAQELYLRVAEILGHPVPLDGQGNRLMGEALRESLVASVGKHEVDRVLQVSVSVPLHYRIGQEKIELAAGSASREKDGLGGPIIIIVGSLHRFGGAGQFEADSVFVPKDTHGIRGNQSIDLGNCSEHQFANRPT
jgi:hypothetical protein